MARILILWMGPFWADVIHMTGVGGDNNNAWYLNANGTIRHFRRIKMNGVPYIRFSF